MGLQITQYDVELGDEWAYGPGVLHGGWLLETVTATALRDSDHPDPLAVSAHFAAAPRVGPAQVEVERLRTGRSVATTRARLVQDDTPRLEVTMTSGRLGSPGTPDYAAPLAPPVLPPLEECVRAEAPANAKHRNGITEQLDIRMEPAAAGWQSGAPPTGEGEIRAWVRSAVGREPDPLFLLTVADGLPPVTFALGILGWVPTVELTVHVRQRPEPGWLRCVQRATLVQDGWLDEECLVWDSAGRLVAQARQLAGYRVPKG